MSGVRERVQSGVVATRTPNRTKQSVKTSKFEFDAPQFEDFCHPRYAGQRRLLEEAVLPAEQRTEWMVDEIEEEEEETRAMETSGDSGDEWFQRPHLEHEPTSPFSPVGALISPERDTPRSTTATTPRSTPRPISKSTPRSVQQDSLMSPRSFRSPTPVRGLGLRSKPQRVIPGNSGGSSLASAASPQLSSPMVMEFSQIASLVKSPTTRWQVTMADPRSSSSIERSVIPSLSDTSLPTITGWSSIPETPPVLASALFDADMAALGKRSLPKDSPMVRKELPIPLIKRIGLASRAMRVPAPEPPGVDSLTIEPIAAPPRRSSITVTKKRSPVIKRLRVDARFCPAPSVLKSKTGSRNTSPLKTVVPPKKEKPVKLDDLKKLLAEHNQKLRPQMNITRRR
ncbi:hypothetical protein PSACC_02303 [Paramicrosporidium saccamoebae]|uniref:Uncharacterized protein n=1 Tax=Paramicrosporidium saccamoebae TaxID=1246581 RepID=A0A2H9TJD5_9FUNG|nr:hypothetical protein PSACC_02303 [Paramicrosporidium saccamoebae]